MAKRRRAALEAEDADFETTEGVKAIGSFEEMGIKDDLLRGIYQYGFEKPSAIQQRAVTPIIQGRDVIAQAQSGTGKSSMIALTVCQIVDTSVREVQALIVSPTRELASQTEKVILAIGDFINIQAHACIGGKSEGEDMSKLEYGVHVVSGTPGRVCDMIKRRTLRTRAIKLLVLDESDEMLSRGFKDQIYDVYRYLPPDLQVVLISATLPHEILEMTNKFMTDPVRILVKRDELTLELKRTQSDRERGRKRESESERSHGSGRGRGSDREERKEKKKVENNEFDDDDDNGRRNNRSLKSRHERSPEHHRNGKRSHRSHSPPQPHASTAANGKPLDEVTNSRGAEQMNDEDDSVAKMKAAEEALEEKQKQKPSFELSGKLAAETNRFRGVTLLFNEPPEARKPDIKWRLYVFKAGEVLNEPLYIHRQSCYLFGRERRVADIPTDHPSCSKQHAVIQFRQVENEEPDGTVSKQIRPYIMDLGSTNKTFVNESPIEPQRYYELRERDTIKFGNSSREYVLLHENSIG